MLLYKSFSDLLNILVFDARPHRAFAFESRDREAAPEGLSPCSALILTQKVIQLLAKLNSDLDCASTVTKRTNQHLDRVLYFKTQPTQIDKIIRLIARATHEVLYGAAKMCRK